MRRRGFVAALAPLATELLLSDVLSCWYVSGVVMPVCTPPVPRCDWHAARADSDLSFKCAGPGLRLGLLLNCCQFSKYSQFFLGKQFHYPLHGEKTHFRAEAAARPESIHRMQECLLVVVPTRNENDASSHSDSEPGRARKCRYRA
jgi:hypothetical protein